MKKIAAAFSGSILTLICFLAFLLFIILVLPGQSEQAGEYTPEGAGFDTQFFYSAASVYPGIDMYGQAGRSAYILQRWTFDLAWPVVYGLFSITAAGFSLTRLQPKNTIWYWLLIFAFLAVGFDFLENISLTVMMAAFPRELAGMPVAASIVSGSKWVSVFIAMGTAVVLPVVLLVQKLFSKTS